MLGVALVVAWAAFRVAEAFGRGSPVAAKIIAVAWVPYTGFWLYEGVQLLGETLDEIGDLVNLVLWIGTPYFMFRGLLAARAFWRSRPTGAARALVEMASPWESAAKVLRPSAFANKRSLGMYLFLLLLPLPWLVMQASAVNQALRERDATVEAVDSDCQLGRQIGQLFVSLAIILPATTALYRKARRRAVRRATDISGKHDRPVLLYLRSFGDDRLKMRARRGNGRSWLEAVLRISFEEVVVDHLFRYGPVVAIGRPGEGRPLGAVRDYVPDGAWQARMDQLLGQAGAIVMVAGRTAGLGWELDEVLRRGLARKLILLLPPVKDAELRARWTWVSDRIAQATGASPIADVDPMRARAILLRPGEGAEVISAEDRDDWTYEVVLDAAVAQVMHGAALGASADPRCWWASRRRAVTASGGPSGGSYSPPSWHPCSSCSSCSR